MPERRCGPSAGRAVCSQQLRAAVWLLCPVMCPAPGCRRQAVSGQCPSTHGGSCLGIWSPSGFQPSSFPPLLRGMGWGCDSLSLSLGIQSRGKPRMLQHNYLIWGLARPSQVMGSLSFSLTNNWQSVLKGRQCVKVAAF